MIPCPHCSARLKDDRALQEHILTKHVVDGSGNQSLTTISTDARLELGLTKNELDVITETLTPGANPSELLYFLNACKSYGLDPIKKEIYFTKLGGKVTIMVSRDGYLKLAQRNPDFRGIHSATVYENDTFTITTSTDGNGDATQSLTHTSDSFGDRGKIVGAWTRIDMANQSPIYVLVDWNEYAKKTPIWQTYGASMIRKCGESIALKRVGDASGLVSVVEVADGRYPNELQMVDTKEIECGGAQ